jgi:hypothetical protein
VDSWSGYNIENNAGQLFNVLQYAYTNKFPYIWFH